MTAITRVCAEQDCPYPSNRPDQPLCYCDYLKLKDDTISLCSDCQVTYKTVGYSICRNCYRRQGDVPRQSCIRESGGSWETALQPCPDVKAVETVRQNIEQHRDLCTNHETNTIQYLVLPLLEGLGWDSKNPDQVVREYAPTGKKWRGNHKKVDVALFAGGQPIVFVEVKRLDREFRSEYMDQLKDYASNMDSGFAVLTNGQYWLISSVTDGVPQPRRTVDILKGSAEETARELNELIGKTAMANARRSTPIAPRATSWSTGLLTREQITDALKDYRGREAQRRRRPVFTIYSDETIALIVKERPTNTAELRSIKGIGPTILRQHGAAILKILAGQRP